MYKFLYNAFLKRFINNIYWGRSNLHKKIVNSFIFVSTILLAFSGLIKQVIVLSTSRNNSLYNNSLTFSFSDIVSQGYSIQPLEFKKLGRYFNVIEYTVQNGDSLESIAVKHNVTKDTIKWANPKIDYYTEKINIGDILLVPEISGVLYEVKEGETIEDILKKTSGDKFKVIEINQLEGPDFKLYKGQKIIIPDGSLPPPPPPPPLIPPQNFRRIPSNQGQNIYISNYINDIPITNPLSNPMCIGYVFVRGFFPGHNGVDVSKGGGCPIRSIASGRVIFSGWSPWGEGYTVRIDHGNGVQSSYLHGETLWVSVGQYIDMGQEIMYMGTTGNSTGVHLHLSIKINGVFVDPLQFITF